MKKVVVIKIGSSIAVTSRGKLDGFRFAQIAKQIQTLQNDGFGVVLVISGAVKAGTKYNKDASKELRASIGQAFVVQQLVNVFSGVGIIVGQMLLTKRDLENRKKDVQKIIHEAIAQNIILIFNENDCVELNSFSGNDFLAAEIATYISASHLLLLTDVDGVYNEQMEIIKVYSDSCSIGFIKNNFGGVGGIASKILAGKSAAEKKIKTIIANGQERNILTRILLQNEHIGTQVIGGSL